ncbi:hypothetical protein Q7P37_005091 [Cladosporium fusiforme]
MPPKATVNPDEDVKFLLTIIKLAGVGTPDWQKVADELELPSRGAAAKRFSRLPGKYGIEGHKASDDTEATPKKAKATPKKTPGSAKKRKVDEAVEDDAEDDAEDGIKAETDD